VSAFYLSNVEMYLQMDGIWNSSAERRGAALATPAPLSVPSGASAADSLTDSPPTGTPWPPRSKTAGRTCRAGRDAPPGGDLPVHRIGFRGNGITGPRRLGSAADRSGGHRRVVAGCRARHQLIDTAESYGRTSAKS